MSMKFSVTDEHGTKVNVLIDNLLPDYRGASTPHVRNLIMEDSERAKMVDALDAETEWTFSYAGRIYLAPSNNPPLHPEPVPDIGKW